MTQLESEKKGIKIKSSALEKANRRMELSITQLRNTLQQKDEVIITQSNIIKERNQLLFEKETSLIQQRKSLKAAVAWGSRVGPPPAASLKNYDYVHSLIKQSKCEAGIDRDSLFRTVNIVKNMSKDEMDHALDFLSSEGHIYSTIDEDHYKSTDGD